MWCNCKDYSVWDDIEKNSWSFLYAHGITYPKEGPFFRFCPFCGKDSTMTEKLEYVLEKKGTI